MSSVVARSIEVSPSILRLSAETPPVAGA